jgi:hypothetical protein
LVVALGLLGKVGWEVVVGAGFAEVVVVVVMVGVMVAASAPLEVAWRDVASLRTPVGTFLGGGVVAGVREVRGGSVILAVVVGAGECLEVVAVVGSLGEGEGVVVELHLVCLALAAPPVVVVSCQLQRWC